MKIKASDEKIEIGLFVGFFIGIIIGMASVMLAVG